LLLLLLFRNLSLDELYELVVGAPLGRRGESPLALTDSSSLLAQERRSIRSSTRSRSGAVPPQPLASPPPPSP